MTTRYVVRLPDGRHAYHLPTDTDRFRDMGVEIPSHTWGAVTWTLPDGTALEPLELPGWLATPTRVDMLHAHIPGRKRVASYRLRWPEASSQLYPPILTVDEFERRTDDEPGDYDKAVIDLYEPIQESAPPVVVPVSLSGWLDLDGEMPAMPNGCTWSARLPYELTMYRAYRHLFPGELQGYQRLIVDAIRAADLPGVALDWYKHEAASLKIAVQQGYQPERTKRVDVSNTRRPRYEIRPDRHTVRLTVDLGHHIAAPNLAAALAALARDVDAIVDEVSRAAAETLCGHCAGTGLAAPVLGGRVKGHQL